MSVLRTSTEIMKGILYSLLSNATDYQYHTHYKRVEILTTKSFHVIPKQENIQFMESIPPSLSCKSKDSSCYDTVDFFQPEGSSMKTEHDNFLINSVERKNSFSNFK